MDLLEVSRTPDVAWSSSISCGAIGGDPGQTNLELAVSEQRNEMSKRKLLPQRFSFVPSHHSPASETNGSFAVNGALVSCSLWVFRRLQAGLENWRISSVKRRCTSLENENTMSNVRSVFAVIASSDWSACLWRAKSSPEETKADSIPCEDTSF